jgi:hypothetical protein
MRRVVRSQDIEYTPGKGRGSRRKGRMGARAIIHTDDDGETFYVSVHDTIAGQLTSEFPEVSTAFDDLDAADKWAGETLLARKRTWLGASMQRNAHQPLAISGTAYQFEGLNWRRSSDEDWETVMYSPYGERVRFVGERVIDGSPVHVWRAGPMRFIAQLAHMSPNAAPPPPPRRRRTADPSLRRVRAIVEREERPFEPERRYPRETKPHHFVVNAGLEQWREPDDASEYSAVWYGPGGREEAEQATEIESTSGGWYVREYQHMAGYVDDFDPDEPFLVTEAFVDQDETLAALDEAGITDLGRFGLLRYAVAFGVADLAERGGSESYAAELP